MRRIAMTLVIGVVAGCGSSLPPGVTPAPPDSVSADCAAAMADLTDALLELDSRLSVGMTYAVYSGKVADAKVAYDRIKVGDLDTDCLRGVAAPAEDALNEYLSAYTIWNDCIGQTGCTNDSIRAKLQDHWAKATTLLTPVKKRLP